MTRLALWTLAIFMLQSMLSGLFAQVVAPPDLAFVLTMAVVASNVHWIGLPVAFGLGLLLDASASGHLGLHAVGLLVAAYAHYASSRVFHWHELAGRIIVVLISYAAKWVAVALMALWLNLNLLEWDFLWKIMLPEAVLTIVASIALSGWMSGMLGVRHE